MLDQQRLDRAAQQRGVMSRHGRDQQHARQIAFAVRLEMQQAAEGLGRGYFFRYLKIVAANANGFDVESGLGETAGAAFEQLGAGSDTAAKLRLLADGKQRVMESGVRRLCRHAERREGGMLPIMEMVKKHFDTDFETWKQFFP